MKTPLLTFLGSVVYATARYNVLKGVPWADWPTYTLNKAFALSSLLLLVLAVVRPRSARADASALSGAGVCAAIHVTLSLILLSPVYFEKLFVHDRLTGAAGLSMALGAAVAAVMTVGKRAPAVPEPGGRSRMLAVLAFAIGLHAALQGFAGWWTPSTWPGFLPPITLLSFLLGSVALAVACRFRRPA
jgi:hypothetical protein